MRIKLFGLGFIAVLLSASCEKIPDIGTVTPTGTVKFSIKNMVNGVPLVLNSNTYTNPFGEQYTVSKFKFYLSNVSVTSVPINTFNGRYYLIDAGKPESLSFSFDAPVGTYNSFSFFLGVDSARNVSGAQTGALDPLNDMFWTWNTGYIMAKFEGNSPQSPVVNNKVEYHIGGFSGPNSVTSQVGFNIIPIPPVGPIEVRAGKTSEIFLEADVNEWWYGSFDLKFADNPTVMTPGPLSKSISSNYTKMFTVVEVKNY